MRDDVDSNWFARRDEGLPSPDELMPISQSLITPDLALAFDIRSPSPQTPSSSPPPRFPFSSSQPNSGDFDFTEVGSQADEPARTLKRPRLVWTPQLHKRFVDAVAHLGIKNAVPKTIMQLMSVDGLTRENVASHLQKYRLYLKRIQQGPGACDGSVADSATDRLFATSPVPSHFLRPSCDPYLPFVHPRQRIGHFENPFLSRQHHRIGVPIPLHSSLLPGSYHVEDLESASSTPARKVLTLFPSGG